ncbi:hypothetical protein HMPREF1982_01215 [Clostridiales bacterium oral taxon 876 str. F0540]|nr:hypothetical protein HMPREF1982_01215 [Clostridiales bacterium oral taxon 876 str. F0540]
MKKVTLCLMAFFVIFSYGCSQKKEAKETGNQPVILDSTKAKEKVESKPIENPQPLAKNYFTKPDKIVVYKNGETQNLTESDKLFSDIFINMNGRVKNSDEMGEYALAFGIEDMKNLKKDQTVVEFVYSKAANITVYNQKIEVYGLIFPLTGKYIDMGFLDCHRNHYSGPIGSLDNVGDVLDLLK